MIIWSATSFLEHDQPLLGHTDLVHSVRWTDAAGILLSASQVGICCSTLTGILHRNSNLGQRAPGLQMWGPVESLDCLGPEKIKAHTGLEI